MYPNSVLSNLQSTQPTSNQSQMYQQQVLQQQLLQQQQQQQQQQHLHMQLQQQQHPQQHAQQHPQQHQQQHPQQLMPTQTPSQQQPQQQQPMNMYTNPYINNSLMANSQLIQQLQQQQQPYQQQQQQAAQTSNGHSMVSSQGRSNMLGAAMRYPTMQSNVSRNSNENDGMSIPGMASFMQPHNSLNSMVNKAHPMVPQTPTHPPMMQPMISKPYMPAQQPAPQQPQNGYMQMMQQLNCPQRMAHQSSYQPSFFPQPQQQQHTMMSHQMMPMQQTSPHFRTHMPNKQADSSRQILQPINRQ